MPKERKDIVSFDVWDPETGEARDRTLERYVVDGGDGPHVVVIAGSHGDELLAIDTAKQLYEELDPEEVSGTVSIVPEANMFAAAHGTRETPTPEIELYEDEERNLNRCFNVADPAEEPDGNITQRLAHHILRLVVDADYCFDLHTATRPGYKIDQIRRKTDPDFSSEVQRAQERLVRDSGLEYVIRTRSSSIGSGVLGGVAPRHGVPTVTVEIGGGLYSQAGLQQYLDVVHNLLRCIDVLPGEPERRSQHIYRDLVKVSAPTAGEYSALVDPGDLVRDGDVIGWIDTGDGTVQVTAPYDGLVESVHRKNWVNEGTKLGHIAIRRDRGPIATLVRALSRTLESLLSRASTPS
ncbi:MAG: succinylglutamate desuccinylase/aspartoacylase family protein [Candidatus Nanohaloarchaea archaeon]